MRVLRSHRRRQRRTTHWVSLGVCAVVAAAMLTPVASAAPGAASARHVGSTPDFGPNVTFINPSMSVATINEILARRAHNADFGLQRDAVYFMPGTYGSAAGADDPQSARGYIHSTVGFYESVAGLGDSPDAVKINGNLGVGVVGQFALGTFWRSLSNLAVNPIQKGEPAHTMRWNVSQASPLRRVDISGNLDLSGGQSWGDEIADTRVAGAVTAGFMWPSDGINYVDGQAQGYLRNSQIGSWAGHGASLVFSGVDGAPATSFKPGDITNVKSTPVTRESPFLYVSHGRFKVFVPRARAASSGINWGTGPHDGRSMPISRFYIAKPGDSAQKINRALAAGKNLIITPGVYRLRAPIRVTRPNTVVMGMGYATLVPVAGTAAITTADVPGVVISGLTVDAGATPSDVLVRIGTRGSHHGSARNPTTVSDLFVRIGGTWAGSATTSLEVDQNDVLVDDAWLWRADHGNPGTVGWTVNKAAHGLVVNGDHVTVTGLFVEHYQQAQTVWNGDFGRAVFVESEAPYDPPNQAAYMDGSQDGYPSYQVARSVTHHHATGIVVWTLFLDSAEPVYLHSAVTAPARPGVRIVDTTAGVIYGVGGIQNMINDDGLSAGPQGPPCILDGLESSNQLRLFP